METSFNSRIVLNKKNLSPLTGAKDFKIYFNMGKYTDSYY